MEDKVKVAEKFDNLVVKGTGRAVLMDRISAASRMQQAGGDAFLPDVFARRAKRHELRVVPVINLTIAATTTYADGDFVFTNIGDRDTLVWAAGFEVHGLTTALNSAIVDDVVRQLRALASLTFKFPNGKAVPRSYAEFDLGGIDVNQDGLTTLVAVSMAQRMLRERLIQASAPNIPLGYLGPTDPLVVSLTGITGVTPADSASGVSVSMYLLVEDYPSS